MTPEQAQEVLDFYTKARAIMPPEMTAALTTITAMHCEYCPQRRTTNSGWERGTWTDFKTVALNVCDTWEKEGYETSIIRRMVSKPKVIEPQPKHPNSNGGNTQ